MQTCGVNKRLASVFDTTTLDEAVNCEACPAGMESNASSLVCTDILCAEDEKVSANACARLVRLGKLMLRVIPHREMIQTARILFVLVTLHPAL